MKICFISFNYNAISETFLNRHYNLLRPHFELFHIVGKIENEQKEKFHNVFSYNETSVLERFKLKFKRIFYGVDFYEKDKIIDLVNLIKPNLVVFQFSFLAVKIYDVIHKIKCPIAVIHHGTDLNMARVDKSYRKKLSFVWEKSVKVIVISKFLAKIAQELGLDKNKLETIYLGVPISPKINYLRKSNKFKILSVGRLTSVKNHGLLIDAFKILKLKYDNIELDIVGGGDLFQAYYQKITNLNLTDSVNLIGSVKFDIVKNYMYNCDVFCLVSKKIETKNTCQEEGLPISLLEASSFSKPLIGTFSGGIPEIIIDNYNGYLINQDKYELAKKIEILIKNKERKIIMGSNAYKTVVEKFNEEIQILEFIKVYKNICNVI